MMSRTASKWTSTRSASGLQVDARCAAGSVDHGTANSASEWKLQSLGSQSCNGQHSKCKRPISHEYRKTESLLSVRWSDYKLVQASMCLWSLAEPTFREGR